MAYKKYEFTEEEIKYVLEHWGIESIYSMKNRFGCTWSAVCKLAESYGLEAPTSNVWTEDEINTLKILTDKYHYTEIAKMMGKTDMAIYLKAKRLGITLLQDRRKWTAEEEKVLSELWGTKSIEYIAKKLKRTVFSLKVKAVRMDLGPMIKNNYEAITVSDIIDLLGVSRDRIVGTWQQLGLSLKQIKLTKNCSYYTVTWDDLMKFLEENQNEWDSRNLEINMLGLEPEWLREKRKRDVKENPLWYRKWTKEEIDRAEDLFKCGKSYQEISKILDRSEGAVTGLLRNLGYSYRLPCFWHGSELKFLRENYKNMTYQEISEVIGRTPKAISAKASELGFQKKLVNGRKKTGGKENG